jgi:putative hydrolase of the HAD superfamily
MIRAVLLDALGTLLELDDPAPLLADELRRRDVVITVEQARTAVRAEIAYYRAHHEEASTRERLEDLRRRCTVVLAGALPEHARELHPDEIGDALLAALRFRPYPEVPDTLRRLRAGGIRTVVVSNWDVSLHEYLDATGLASLVDAAVSSAEVGVAKPEPAIFAHALDLAGVVADEALMVGDDVDADVRGAQRAGVAAVLVQRSGAAVAAPSVIVSLAELPRLVQSVA